MSTLRKRLACLNYRCAEETTVIVTRKLVRAYTPRVRAALKAVDAAMRAGELLTADWLGMELDDWTDERVLPEALLSAVKAEFEALDWRMDYLFDVVQADLGPRVARELMNEFARGGFVVR